MVEGYSEDDLAREMEELKLKEAAEGGEGGNGGPRRRGPPRRKTGSSNLTAFRAPTGGEAEEEGKEDGQ